MWIVGVVRPHWGRDSNNYSSPVYSEEIDITAGKRLYLDVSHKECGTRVRHLTKHAR